MTQHEMLPRWWMISSGEYSDYRVHAVFEDQNTAVAAVAEFDGEYDTYEVQPIAIYRAGVKPKWVTTHVYREWFGVEQGYNAGWSERTEPEFDMMTQASERATAKLHRSGTGCMLSVTGTNKQAVAQSVSDNRAQIRAHFELTGSYHWAEPPTFYFLNEQPDNEGEDNANATP